MQRNRLQKLLEFLEQEPSDPFLKYALATEYLRLNEADTALTYYEDLVNNHPAYVGTYYHLGKLYEAMERKADAIRTYENGMAAARDAGDNHALSELRAVYQSAIGLNYEDD
ncbi:tetratricopeptide repeat protein [Hufsiella ginkgonis]|uniref:Tetratricopeptide repeat protein n=1 Tax=Hufsiella ginkgonis TaxID=2695274 RepID=A0A7K1XVU6_9SPHI|nr:tetratricopeptide repeat protein [Hufsiella ginkgonis]MXV15104.1 tetratricopeptide repeat protein [Hufsiella ginkgonis]